MLSLFGEFVFQVRHDFLLLFGLHVREELCVLDHAVFVVVAVVYHLEQLFVAQEMGLFVEEGLELCLGDLAVIVLGVREDS